jgi:phosphoribosylformimino-5-aminoimidazole carboxamide ribotide isomerase
MRIIGVIDLIGGVVVRAIAGRREAYRPIVSPLCPGSAPSEVAEAFLSLGVGELYVADLDAIAGAEPAWAALGALPNLTAPLWVDAGVREESRAMRLAQLGVDRVVVGLESVPDPATLGRLVDLLGDRLVFSLDLREGRPLGGWSTPDPFDIAEEAIRHGVRRILVLDLARVGVHGGPGTAALCARLVAAHPGVEVSAGGGIRDRADLERLRSIGVAAVLVASALHDGHLRREDIAAFCM